MLRVLQISDLDALSRNLLDPNKKNQKRLRKFATCFACKNTADSRSGGGEWEVVRGFNQNKDKINQNPFAQTSLLALAGSQQDHLRR